MRVFKINDDDYPSWIVANNAQEALDYYKNNIVGDEDLPLTVEKDVLELSDEDCTKEMVIDNLNDDVNDEEFIEKSFAEILKENEGSEDPNPWMIASTP